MPYPVPMPGSAPARLIDAALAQFEDQGFDGANVTDIAAEAGVTTGSLYHHFGSKLGLYEVIRAEMLRRLTERMEGAAAAAGPGTGALQPALSVAFDAAVRFRVPRILSEPHPHPDPIAEELTDIGGDPLLARLLTAAWREALAAIAEGSETDLVREKLLALHRPG